LPTRKQKNLLGAATGGARTVMMITLRFAENLGKGPQFSRASQIGTIDVGWLFTTPPEGLEEKEMSPDLTVRIQFSNVTGVNLGAETTVSYGPYLPDAAIKKQICQDTLELLSIEARQKGGA